MGRLIAFTDFAGSGKTTAADLLADYGFKKAPLAGPLKDIAKSMGWNGKKDKKGRRLLQLLGTECGRECVGPECWTRLWEERYAPELAAGAQIVIDDLRFPNEAEMVQRLGGRVYRIDRLAARPAAWRLALYGAGVKRVLHRSEWPLPAGLCHMTIRNDEDISDLRHMILTIVCPAIVHYLRHASKALA